MPKTPFPGVGDAFAVPLPNGTWGGCRVIRVGDPRGAGPLDSQSVLIGAIDWIGQTKPNGVEPGFTRLLRLTHHAHRDRPAVVWVAAYRGPMPETFELIGQVPPSTDDLMLDVNTWADWTYIPSQIDIQFRWADDRDAVLRQDAADRERKVELDRIAKVRHQHYLDTLTLDVLREEQPFAHWDRLWTAAIISRARNIFRDTIDELISLGPRPALHAARPILRACIEQFNELNGTGDFVIETDEREDICKHFRLMIHAAGLAGDTPIDLEDEWRQW